MLTLLRSYLGHPIHTGDDDLYHHAPDIETGPPPRGRTPSDPFIERYHWGNSSRPIECEPECDFYDDFFELFPVAPSRDGRSLLVYSNEFLTEVNGVAIFDSSLITRCDDDETAPRVPEVVRLYEHLFAERKAHSRIVRYLGPTISGYRLERLDPGPMGFYCNRDFPPARDNDAVLALYQRWALQALSALAFIHSRGIITHAVCEKTFWLRSDFSIALANLISAASIELDIPERGWISHSRLESPWTTHGDDTCPPYNKEEAEHPKVDIFDWASWVYQLMSGYDSPIDSDERTISYEEFKAAQRLVTKRRFTDWPVLEDRMLGPVLLRAWKGEYKSADETLGEARKLLLDSGRTLSPDAFDDIDGVDWQQKFEVRSDERGHRALCLRRHEKQ